MATRFYLPSSGTSPLASLAVASSWEHSGASFFRAPTFQDVTGTALTTKAATFPDISTDQQCHAQFVSAPLAAGISFTTSDTISMVINGLEGNAAVDGHLAYTVRVVSIDGSTVRGTIAEFHATSSELTTSLASRIHSARAFNNNVTAYRGDRIVIEIGTHGVTPSTAYTHSWRFGDPIGTMAQALTAFLTTDYLPWVEISPNLTFQSLGVPDVTAGTSITNGPDKANVSSGIIGHPTYVKKANVKLSNTGTGHAACNAKAILYTWDGANGPDLLLGTSDAVAIADNQAAGWVEFTFAVPVLASVSGMGNPTAIGVIGDENAAGLYATASSTASSPRANSRYYWTDDYTDGPMGDVTGVTSYTTSVRLLAYATEVTDLTATVGVTAAAAGCAIAAEALSTDRTLDIGVTAAKAGGAASFITAEETFAATVGVTAAASSTAITAAETFSATVGVTAAKAGGAAAIMTAVETFSAEVGVTATKAGCAVTAANTAQATVGVTAAKAGCSIAATETFDIVVHEPQENSTHYIGDALDIHFSVAIRPTNGTYHYTATDQGVPTTYYGGSIAADGRAGDYEVTMSTSGLSPAGNYIISVYWYPPGEAYGDYIYGYLTAGWSGGFAIAQPPRTLTIGVTAAAASTDITATAFDDARTLEVGVTGAAASTSITALEDFFAQVGVTAAKAGVSSVCTATNCLHTSLPTGSTVQKGGLYNVEFTCTPGFEGYAFGWWIDPSSQWVACHLGLDFPIHVGQTSYSYQMDVPYNGAAGEGWFALAFASASAPWGEWADSNSWMAYHYIEVQAQAGVAAAPASSMLDVVHPEIAVNTASGQWQPTALYYTDFTVKQMSYGTFDSFVMNNDTGLWYYLGSTSAVANQTTYHEAIDWAQLVNGPDGDYTNIVYWRPGAWAAWPHSGETPFRAIQLLHVESGVGVTAAAAGTNLQSYVYWAEIAVQAMAAGMSADATLNYLASLGCSAAAAGVAVSAAETFVMTVGVTAAAAGTSMDAVWGYLCELVALAAAASVSITATNLRGAHPHRKAQWAGRSTADIVIPRVSYNSGIIVDGIDHRATQKKGAVDGFDNN